MTAGLTAKVSTRAVNFSYTERDAGGRLMNIYPPGKATSIRTMSVRMVDSQKRAVYGNEMKGDSIGWHMEWKPREGLSGKFTATVECDAGPFITKPATATFTVK